MTTKSRDSFIFYRSFFEAINHLESEKKCEIYDAIFAYSFDEKEPVLSGISASIFTLIKPQLDANRSRFENGCKKKKKSKTEAKQKQNESKTRTNVNVNVNLNENENENENLKSKSSKDFLEKDFEEFWQNYTPVKTKDGRIVDKGSKKLAKAAYEKALKKYSVDQIFQGTQDYLIECFNNDRLTCQASVMLNQERFVMEDFKTLTVKKT